MKHKTTFEKLLGTNAGRSKNWKTLRAICERPLFESLFKENRTSKQLQILLQ